jgi:hypothetical protein
MVDFEQIGKLLNDSGSVVAEAITVLYPFNEVFYQDSRTMVLAFSVLMAAIATAVYFLSNLESNFKPKTVVVNLVISLALLTPVSTTPIEFGDNTGVDTSEKIYPVSVYIGWKAIKALLDYSDAAQNAIEKKMKYSSVDLLSSSYSLSLLSSYKEPNIAKNVSLYRNTCNPYATGEEAWSESFGTKPSDEDLRAIGLLEAFLGFDETSRGELEQYSTSLGELFDVDSYVDEDGSKSMLAHVAGVFSPSTWWTGLIGDLVSTDQTSQLEVFSKIPRSYDQVDLFDSGLLIPTRKHLVEVAKNGISHVSDSATPESFLKNTTMKSVYDSKDDPTSSLNSANLSYKENLFYPKNCAQLYEVARKSVVNAMAANYYYAEDYGDKHEHDAERINNIGVSQNIYSINALAMGAFYDQDKFGEKNIGNDATALLETVTGFFKSISTDFNAASVFGWCVIILAILINIFPLVAIFSSLVPSQGQVYLVYAQLILSTTLTLILLRLANYAVSILYSYYVGVMQIQMIESGDVSQVNGGIMISLHYGALLVVSIATVGSWMIVSGKLSQMNSGTSHSGETAAAATFAVTKMASGAISSMSGMGGTSAGKSTDVGDWSFRSAPPTGPSFSSGPALSGPSPNTRIPSGMPSTVTPSSGGKGLGDDWSGWKK